MTPPKRFAAIVVAVFAGPILLPSAAPLVSAAVGGHKTEIEGANAPLEKRIEGEDRRY